MHDVFICHSSKDKGIAEAVCATLEGQGIRCWISPRDVVPSTDYASSIVDAIASSAVVVLVFSSHSNHSGHVGREIERAVSHGVPILPFRVEAVEPSPALEYYISVSHWLDAFTPPVEQHLDRLADTIHVLLDRAEAPPEPITAPPLVVADEVPLAAPATASVDSAAGTATPVADAPPPPTEWPMHWDNAPAPEPEPTRDAEPFLTAIPLTPTPHARDRRPRKRWLAVVAAVALVAAGVALANRGGGACDVGPGADLAACDLSGRDLQGADLTDATLTDADLSDADLTDADLSDADLTGADLTGALARGAQLTGADLTDTDLTDADLSGASITDADLSDAVVDGTDLSTAELDRAVLAGLDLRMAYLSEADLSEADLTGALLAGADLSGASLLGADLSGADLTAAIATDVEVEGAIMVGTILDGIDLTGAIGLSDAMLLDALGVPAEQLAGEATLRGIRTDPLQVVLDAARAVSDGGTVVGAAAYQPSDGFHPVAILGPESGVEPDWAAEEQTAWAPSGVRFTELVVLVGTETWNVVEVCEYWVGDVPAPPITRYQATTTAQIVSALSGEVVAERSFLGTVPRACGPNEPYDLTELRGELPDMTLDAVAWIASLVHPPAP